MTKTFTETTQQSLLAHRVTRLEQELKTIAHGLKLLNSANSLQTGFNNAVIRDVALGNKQVQQITEDVSTLQKCVEDLYEAGNDEDDVEEGSEDYDYDYSDDAWLEDYDYNYGDDGWWEVELCEPSTHEPADVSTDVKTVNKDMQDDYALNPDIWTREVVHLILHG